MNTKFEYSLLYSDQMNFFNKTINLCEIMRPINNNPIFQWKFYMLTNNQAGMQEDGKGKVEILKKKTTRTVVNL